MVPIVTGAINFVTESLSIAIDNVQQYLQYRQCLTRYINIDYSSNTADDIVLARLVVKMDNVNNIIAMCTNLSITEIVLGNKYFKVFNLLGRRDLLLPLTFSDTVLSLYIINTIHRSS